MADVEHEQAQDDFEVEITHIDASDSSTNSNTLTGSSEKPSHSPMLPRFSLHQRRLQLMVTISLVVLALLIILGSSAPVRQLAVSIFTHSTTPTPTLAPGENLFYVLGNPPWGQHSLDGHVQSRLPTIGRDSPFRLSRGRHQLVWKADPFPTQSCTVSVPFSYSDTCVHRETATFGGDRFAWVISFSVSLAMLSNEQRTALIHAAQLALDTQRSTETVQAGEMYYVLTEPCNISQPTPLCFASAKASHPLLATLHFQLQTDPLNGSCVGLQVQCTTQQEDCHSFCAGETIQSGQEWDVYAVVRPLWNYATLEGKIISQNVPDNAYFGFVTGDVADEYLAHLHIIWESGEWYVAALLANSGLVIDPTCGATHDLTNLGGFLIDTTIDNMPIQWLYASGSNHAAGCLAIAVPQPSAVETPTSSSPAQPAAYCLQRFGVLLAANDLAHRLWPSLPLADTNEQSLAQQLATLVQVPST